VVQYCAAGEAAAAATGRLAKRYRRQWYRRAWLAQHDWSKLTLGDVEDDRPRQEPGGFPFANYGSELRSQHSAMAACRGLTGGLLHSIAQAGWLQPGVWSTRTSPCALARHWRPVGNRARRNRARRALARGGALRDMAPPMASSHHLIIQSIPTRIRPVTYRSSHGHAAHAGTACHVVLGPVFASCSCPHAHHSSARAVDCQ
jgi:hypothetical protein